jgi:hypothetical protein
MNSYTIAGLIFIFIGLTAYILKRLKGSGASDFASAEMIDFEVLEVQMSKTEEASKDSHFSALIMENMFSSLHGLLKTDPSMQEHISFEVVSSGDGGIKFYVAVPSNILKFVESQLYAQLPNARIRVVQDYSSRLEGKGLVHEVSYVSFLKPNFFPIKSFRDFEVDPLSSLTSAMASLSAGDELWLQFVVRPLADVWQKEGQSYVNSVRDGTYMAKSPSLFSGVSAIVQKEIKEILVGIAVGAFTTPVPRAEVKKPDAKPLPPRLTASQELELRSIENKLGRMGFWVQIRMLSASESSNRVGEHLRSVTAALNQFSLSTLNGFTSSLDGNSASALELYRKRVIEKSKALILNTEELASIFHFPSSSNDTPTISWVFSKSSEPPADIPTENCNYIGETLYRSKKVRFGLKNDDDRLRHLYLIGKSGTGKSSLLYSMACQDISNGAGVAVLDPHGETIDQIMDRIPEHRINDVVYFDPSDTDHPIGLNLLQLDDPSQKNLMASGLVSAIKQHFDYSWGPRLEYLLNYAILTLLEVPMTTMLGITRLMEDDNYQKYILHQVKDPLVVKFWEKEFKEMKGNQKLVTETISPIQNKVNRFLASSTIRNILGQGKSTINLWDIMNSGKILLINLSKGKIGSDNANLLGALLVSRLQFYALQRARIPYEQRTPFYMYVDEFQNFATGSFEEILSESRKYKLGLYLTHQFTDQLPEKLLKAVYGNVGTIISFGLGAPDALELQKEFAPYFTFEDIQSLERFQVYIKLMINGMTSHPFSGKILIPWEDEFLKKTIPVTGNRERVIAQSREKYGSDVDYVTTRINRWIETKFDKGMAIAQEYKDKEKNLVASAGSDQLPIAKQPSSV